MPPPRTVAAGRRDKYVTIQQALGEPSSGFPVDTWTTLGQPVWMSREDVEGDERFDADRLTARHHTVWVMPYQSTMDPDLIDVPKRRRLLYQGRVYDIVSARLMWAQGDIAMKTLASTKRAA